MKKYIIITFTLFIAVTGYLLLNSAAKKVGKAPTIEEQILSSDKILTPEDLGIRKTVMHAQHGDDEVVVLRSRQEFDGKLILEITSYHRDKENKIISIPIIEIKKNFFSTMGSFKAKGRPDFCDSIEINCGGFSIEFDHLYFSGSNSSHSEIQVSAGKRMVSRNKNESIVRFNEQWEDKGRELKLTFTLEPMLYSDALKECPKLRPIEENHGWTYQDVKFGTQDAHRAWSDSIKRGEDGSLYQEKPKAPQEEEDSE